MAVAYVISAIVIIVLHADKLPWATEAIFSEAFAPRATAGGVLWVMIPGFRRAVFSNEAGIDSAAIAYSGVRTKEPATEGFVSLLGPFLDVIIICTLTTLVILTTVYELGMEANGIQGVELTSQTFESTIGWSTVPLSCIVILFSFSTMISWSYYGMKGWTYIFGESKGAEMIFKLMFCSFVWWLSLCNSARGNSRFF